MLKKQNTKKIIILAVLFFASAFSLYAAGRGDASRWNIPKLDVSTIDTRTRLVRFDWSKVDYPDDFRFGLYRLDRSTRTNVFLKEVLKTDTQFADVGLQPPLYNYFYLVESVPKDELLQERKDIRAPSDREIAAQTISAYYIDMKNPQFYMDDDVPAYSERSSGGSTAALPRPPPGRRTTQPQSPNEGIYIGLMSFSGKVKEITKEPVLLPLDPAGRQELMDKLNVAYTLSRDFGSAPYYAVHNALANLSELQRTGGLPRNVENVSIITFTDGLDTSSTDSSFTPLEGKDFRPSSGSTPDDYKSYIIGELKNRQIAGKNISAWTIGVEGRNIKNNWTFTQLLREMSTDDEHYAKLGDINQLESNLSTLADVLNIYTSIVNITITTPTYPIGTTVRLTFDNNVTDPYKAKYWVEGDVDWVSGKYVLTNLCSNGIKLGDTNNVLGIRTDRGIEYRLRLNDDFYSENLRQWQLPPAVQNLPANWVLINDFPSEKSLDFIRNRSSSIIYLVLDSNPALKQEEIDSIRTAVQVFIDKLYKSAMSGIKLQPVGGAPLREIAAVEPAASGQGRDGGDVSRHARMPRVKGEESPLPREALPAESRAETRRRQRPDALGTAGSPAPVAETRQRQEPAPAKPPVVKPPPAPPQAEVYAPAAELSGTQNEPQKAAAASADLRAAGSAEPPIEMPLPVLTMPPPPQNRVQNNIQVVRDAQGGASISATISNGNTAITSSSSIAPQAGGAAAGKDSPALAVTVTPQAGPRSSVSVYMPTQEEAVKAPPPTAVPPAAALKPSYKNPEKGFWIQLGAYIDLVRAQRAAAPLASRGYAKLGIYAKELNGSLYYRVKMGPYLSRAEADGVLSELGRLAIPMSEGFVVRE
ncbi:MAG: SPOR domain-containing protein [Spirochaetaceae bacterium]|nr:SPOR domain-containing protein [Spirochaetaceae bacterium]